MTTTTPTAGPLDRRTNRPSVWSAFLPLLAGVVALIVALVLIVVIRPLGWRLLATIALWVVGCGGAHRVRGRGRRVVGRSDARVGR